MNWKPDVVVEKKEEYWIKRGKKIKKVPQEDAAIVELMQKGITGDEELIECVEREIEHDKLLAGFRLAQFVEDYGEYLQEAEPSRIIEV